MHQNVQQKADDIIIIILKVLNNEANLLLNTLCPHIKNCTGILKAIHTHVVQYI